MERDRFEVREGVLACRRCELNRRVQDGIVDLLYDAPSFVRREARGLERFAEEMRASGWDRERIRALPHDDHGYWGVQAGMMRSVLEMNAFAPGERLLDVGANTCWASNIFARRGLEVIALDITEVELQGLRTADYFIDRGEVYFERVLSVMFDMAIASESLDWVFCCEVLHHNDRAGLRRTMREAYRVLRPGGRLIVANEPMRFPLRLKLDQGSEVAHLEGNEHVYFMHQYLLAARAAGFRIALPGLRNTRRVLAARGEPSGRMRGLKSCLRASRAGRRAILVYWQAAWWWRHAMRGDRSLQFVCTKPRDGAWPPRLRRAAPRSWLPR